MLDPGSRDLIKPDDDLASPTQVDSAGKEIE
jgi:hypothetical protein